MASLGDILTIAHIIKRAHDLYTACAAAPAEISIASTHIHTLALVLEGVKSDLVANPHSFIHQATAVAQTRQHALKAHLGTCERALKRMEKLLARYLGFRTKHVSLWDRYRWSAAGKQEIAEAKADVVLATSVLDIFLSAQGLSVLWKMEGLMEGFMRRIEGLEALVLSGSGGGMPSTADGRGSGRLRSGSNVTRTLVLSLVLGRLRKALRRYRGRKLGKRSWKEGGGNQKKNGGAGSGPRRPRPAATRVNSGFGRNNTRFDMLAKHASNIATDCANPNPPPYEPRRPRTPSPETPYMPGFTPPKVLRRSSSLNGRVNSFPKPLSTRTSTEHFECWRIGIGKLAIGPKTAPQFVPHKRGQMQLRKIAAVFKEASVFDRQALNEGDSRVKAILKAKNDKLRKEGSRKKWYFVAGRVVGRDPGRTGMVSVEKAVVVLVRR